MRRKIPTIQKQKERITEMRSAINSYVDNLFKDAPAEPAVNELKEEILSNLQARYDDCINAGMTPQRAYAAVIGTMGDVSGLIAQVSGSGFHEEGLFEKSSPKSRLMKKYAYVFKESNIKAIKGAAIAIMWLLIVLFYFLISYSNYCWDTSWLLFIVGAGLTVGINMIGDVIRISKNDDTESRIKLLKKIQGSSSAIMWFVVVFFYFAISFNGASWDISWIIFILGTIAQIIINTVFKVLISRFKP